MSTVVLLAPFQNLGKTCRSGPKALQLDPSYMLSDTLSHSVGAQNNRRWTRHKMSSEDDVLALRESGSLVASRQLGPVPKF